MSETDLASVEAGVGVAARVAPGQQPVTVLDILMITRALVPDGVMQHREATAHHGDPVLKRQPEPGGLGRFPVVVKILVRGCCAPSRPSSLLQRSQHTLQPSLDTGSAVTQPRIGANPRRTQMPNEDEEVQPDPYDGDDDLRWFNEVYRRRFPNDTAMIADLDQQLGRFNELHDGPHVHGCILPGDHPGQCQLPTGQEG
jgi:hypothetical protein